MSSVSRRCNTCSGKTTVPGLGGMPVTCHECNGNGWMEVAVEYKKPSGVKTDVDDIKPVKKRLKEKIK